MISIYLEVLNFNRGKLRHEQWVLSSNIRATNINMWAMKSHLVNMHGFRVHDMKLSLIWLQFYKFRVTTLQKNKSIGGLWLWILKKTIIPLLILLKRSTPMHVTYGHYKHAVECITWSIIHFLQHQQTHVVTWPHCWWGLGREWNCRCCSLPCTKI